MALTRPRTAVVAIGGNALVVDRRQGSIADQFVAAHTVAASVVAMVRAGWRVVLTHGNGPQVGFILRRDELLGATAPEIPRIGLEIAGADSEGGIGHIVSLSLLAELSRAGMPPKVAALITHTVVAASDPAFQAPTKPIGAWYEAGEAQLLREREGWVMVEDSGRGYRRVVPSPEPLRILELEAVAALMGAGFTVIAAGGGGIPVIESEDGGYRGVEAVIDKDRASALLARQLGVDLLVITTGVQQVALNFGRPDQRFLDRITMADAEAHLAEGHFPPGSMGPKIEAALEFLRSGGREVLITTPDRLGDALAGGTGTRLIASAASGAQDVSRPVS
jgi:carbamate kinase